MVSILLPGAGQPVRTPGLWEHTCFEAFLRHPNGRYWEFNFAPSGAWAAYEFDGYRQGMRDLPVERPRVEVRNDGNCFQLQVQLSLPAEATSSLHANFSAVIEETSGRKSYWALAHPPGKADFHHPASFMCEL
jgi:hypothetical protein